MCYDFINKLFPFRLIPRQVIHNRKPYEQIIIRRSEFKFLYKGNHFV